MSVSYVHTLGDSTIDNLYWIIRLGGDNPKERSVEGRLQESLGDQYQVISHAYDGFTTESVLHGDMVGSVLANGGGAAYLQEKCSEQSRDVQPLADLKREVEGKPDVPHYVVLSVGGNDFRVRLGNPIDLLREIPKVQERYLEIVKQIQDLKGRDVRPILMLQYRPDARNDNYGIYTILRWVGRIAVAVNTLCIATIAISSLAAYKGKIRMRTGVIAVLLSGTIFALGSRAIPLKVTKEAFIGHDIAIAMIGALLEKFYAPILERAKEDHIPVLDLTNTFDPYKPLYDSGIEPGPMGGILIANGIEHVVKNHDYQGTSRIYSAPPATAKYDSTENDNPAGWEVLRIDTP